MARLIDAEKLVIERQSLEDLGQGEIEFYSVEQIADAPTVEAIPKADYETRLKADVVAMLTEIQLEIEELDSRAGYSGNGMPTFSTDYIRKKKVNELIQQKINELKAEIESQESEG